MPDRKPERRILAVAAVLTGLGMTVLPTTGMAFLMPWVMQQGAFAASTAAVIQTAHTYGLILGALPMAALAARLGPRRGFLSPVSTRSTACCRTASASCSWGLRPSPPGRASTPAGAGAPRLARIGMGLAAAGHAALAVGLPDGGAAGAWPIQAAGLLAFGLGRGLFTVSNVLALLRAAPPERNAAATGLFVLAGGLGTLLGPLCLVQLPALFDAAEAISSGLWLGLAAGAALVAAWLSRSGAETGGRPSQEPA